MQCCSDAETSNAATHDPDDQSIENRIGTKNRHRTKQFEEAPIEMKSTNMRNSRESQAI
jgi:hypothetical protein